METIDKILKYYELLMVKNIIKSDLQNKYSFPPQFKIVFWKNKKDIQNWINIHISSGEFASRERAEMYFHSFYDNFKTELKNRLFFIENNGKKIATATISPTNEFGYKCVIDWLAISKEFQGKRLSKPLIFECLKIASNLGYKKILLHTQTHTWLAVKLYLDCGFKPFMTEENLKGWQILQTLINHKKLKNIQTLNKKDLFDKLTLNVVKNLNKLHKRYNYEVWNKDNMNDVWVNENNAFYHYKFHSNGKKLILCDN